MLTLPGPRVPLRSRSLELAAAAVTVVFACGCASFRPGADPTRDRANPALSGQLTLAGGDYRHDIDNSVDDETSAGFLSLQAEASSPAGVGAGASIELMNSNNDLFSGTGAADAQATTLEISPYFLYRGFAGEDLRMPIRVGPWFHVLTLDEQGSTDSLQWVSLGLRLAIEPEIILGRTKEMEWTLFSSLSVAGSVTRVHLNSGAGDEDYDTHGSAFGFEIGPRLRWSHFLASISFLHRRLTMDESDPENGTFVNGIDGTFTGVALTFGGGH